MTALKKKLAEKIPAMRDEVKSLIAEHGETRISEVSVAQAYGGMRGIKGLVTETSAVDPVEGIRFRGYSIPEICDKLPKAEGSEQPLPEGLFWSVVDRGSRECQRYAAQRRADQQNGLARPLGNHAVSGCPRAYHRGRRSRAC